MAVPPGPRMPATLQTLRWISRPTPFFERSRRHYGETFTLRFLGAGKLVFTSEPDAIKAMFGADRENRLPASRGFILEPVMGPSSILIQEGSEHMRRRKLMLPPFHGERMRAYEGVIEEITRREIDSWPIGERFALHPRMQSITLNVILRAVFGVEEGPRFDGLRDRLRRLLGMIESPIAQAAGLVLRRLGRLGRVGRYRDFERILARVDALLAEEIVARRDDPNLEQREDILSMLVAARFEDGGAMSASELRDQLMTLLLAGHETTATGLAWTFDLLFRNRAAMERLTSEVRSGEEAYLDATITEALRVRPVIPLVGRRIASSLEVDGYELPPGTDVFASIYTAHTRADVYPDPFAFKPERFLDGGPETYSWIPFGGGTRRCLGAAFATFEMRIVLREVLGRCELSPATSAAEEVTRRNVTLSPRQGTPAVLNERLREAIAA